MREPKPDEPARCSGATLHSVDGARVASGSRLRRQDGQLKGGSQGDGKGGAVVVLDETRDRGAGLARGLDGRGLRGHARSSPSPIAAARPRRSCTTTLQQEASRKLRLRRLGDGDVAPRSRLYENGHITYMRTDSTTLSETAINAARSLIAERYGKRSTCPDGPARVRLQGQERPGGARGDPSGGRLVPHARAGGS